MKSKNLIVLIVWSEVTIIFSLLIALGANYSDNVTQWLITMFDDWWIVFLITLVFTGIISYFVKEQKLTGNSVFKILGQSWIHSLKKWPK